ncbi:MAG: hypothetical protein ACOC42_00400, partial [Halobacteriota archaeon]
MTYGVSFISFPGMAAIQILDPIERRRYRLDADAGVTPTTIDANGFRFPVDRAVRITTGSITLPTIEACYVRRADGTMLTEIDHEGATALEHDAYIVDICAPIKIYLEFDGQLTVVPEEGTLRFEFGSPIDVDIGARSAHEHPEATLETTTEPEDLMATVSAFASALKTTSPERSFPAQRGHPPRVEVADELWVPDALSPPATGISLELRPTVETIFTAATLSYYLSARMEPADRNALVVDGEVIRTLGQGAQLRASIDQLLKHVFTLDCITRTEGAYPVDLDERRRLEARVDLDLGELYDAPSAERLVRYLDIPHVHVSDLVPEWGMAAHVVDDPAHVELLPYLVEDLALIHVHAPGSVERVAAPSSIAGGSSIHANSYTRSSGTTTASSGEYVRLPKADSVDQLWVGDGTPIGASKAIPEAFEHRLEREPTDADIDITVVCNDQQMNGESDIINEIYGSREDLSFDVSIHRDLERDELREVLAEESDFLHYIGHIDDDGVECADGKLDIGTMDEVGTSAFLLNACQSYRQGRHLIERGGIGGIATLSEVINESAVTMGSTLARLLNRGYPLYASLSIAKQESLMGPRYIVVGDGRVALTQPKSIPQIATLTTSTNVDSFSYRTFPTARADLGSMTIPYIGDNDRYFLVSTTI